MILRAGETAKQLQCKLLHVEPGFKLKDRMLPQALLVWSTKKNRLLGNIKNEN